MVKNSDEEKYLYGITYEITFDSTVSWNFDNGVARNDTIFGVDNYS